MIDLINGTFETLGAIVVFLSAWRLYKDKQVRGVSWSMPLFFFSWGAWNPFFYSSLSQWFSLGGALLLLSANVSYLVLLVYYEDKGILPKLKNRLSNWYKNSREQ